MERHSYYEQALAAVAAGGSHPADLLLNELVTDDELDRRYQGLQDRRASSIRSWVVPFLSLDDTQRLADALLAAPELLADCEELWSAIEYAAPAVIQQNFQQLAHLTADGHFGWGLGLRNATDPEIIEHLQRVIANTVDLTRSEHTTSRVFNTRNVGLIESLILHPAGPFQQPNGRALFDEAAVLAWAGFVRDGDQLVDQTTPRRIHLTFPAGYLDDAEFRHPTHDLDAPDLGTAEFGGLATNSCGICNTQLHRYLRLEDQLASFGVHSRSALELAICYDCRDCAYEMFDNVLWYEHDADGAAHSRPVGEWAEHYRRSMEPMAPTTVSLREAPLDRWVSDYSLPPWFRNDNYLGGVPSNAYMWGAPMRCIDCDAVMKFLANIRQNQMREPMLFYWCDDCAISGVAGQSSG